MYHSSSEPRGPQWEGLMFFLGSLLKGACFMVAVMVYMLDKKVLEKWRQIMLLLSYNLSWWNHICWNETLGAFSNSSFTLIHSRQTQCRIYQFWPFPELYTVCDRYLQNLTECGIVTTRSAHPVWSVLCVCVGQVLTPDWWITLTETVPKPITL